MTLVHFWLYGVGMARGKHHLLCGPGGMGTIVKSLTVLASPPGMTPLGQEPLFAQAGKRSSQEARQASLLQGKIGLTVPGGAGCQSV